MQHILINMEPHTKIYQKDVNCMSGILHVDLTWWKKTFNRRGMEDYIWWNTTLDRYWPLMEAGIWWKKPFDKNIFERRRPNMEKENDDLWWKTTLERW